MKLKPELPLLLVDDDRDYLNSFELTLLRSGLTNIIKCYDGSRAIEILKEKKIGLVLSDLSMPGISGFKLLDFIQENKPEIPVIIITANIESHCKNHCLEHGAFAFYNKPCPGTRVAEVISAVLKKRFLKDVAV